MADNIIYTLFDEPMAVRVPSRSETRRAIYSGNVFTLFIDGWNTQRHYWNKGYPQTPDGKPIGRIDNSICWMCGQGYSALVRDSRKLCDECKEEIIAAREHRLWMELHGPEEASPALTDMEPRWIDGFLFHQWMNARDAADLVVMDVGGDDVLHMMALHYGEGLSIRRVAEFVGQSKSCVHKKIVRGRTVFRKLGIPDELWQCWGGRTPPRGKRLIYTDDYFLLDAARIRRNGRRPRNSQRR